MNGIGHGLQITVWQDHACSGFHVRGKHHGRLFFGNSGLNISNGSRNPRVLRAGTGLAGFEHGVRRGDMAHVENLRPAVAEPAVANHHHMLTCGELARHGFHAVGTAARHQRRGMRAINFFQDAGNISHDALKTARHVVKRAVGVDH